MESKETTLNTGQQISGTENKLVNVNLSGLPLAKNEQKIEDTNKSESDQRNEDSPKLEQAYSGQGQSLFISGYTGQVNDNTSKSTSAEKSEVACGIKHNNSSQGQLLLKCEKDALGIDNTFQSTSRNENGPILMHKDSGQEPSLFNCENEKGPILKHNDSGQGPSLVSCENEKGPILKHKDSGQGPSLVSCERENGPILKHKDSGQGPSLVSCESENGPILKHKDSSQGPSLVSCESENGPILKHKDSGQGPSLVSCENENGPILKHKDSGQGPSLVSCENESGPILKHKDSGQGPSLVSCEKDVEHLQLTPSLSEDSERKLFCDAKFEHGGEYCNNLIGNCRSPNDVKSCNQTTHSEHLTDTDSGVIVTSSCKKYCSNASHDLETAGLVHESSHLCPCNEQSQTRVEEYVEKQQCLNPPRFCNSVSLSTGFTAHVRPSKSLSDLPGKFSLDNHEQDYVFRDVFTLDAKKECRNSPIPEQTVQKFGRSEKEHKEKAMAKQTTSLPRIRRQDSVDETRCGDEHIPGTELEHTYSLDPSHGSFGSLSSKFSIISQKNKQSSSLETLDLLMSSASGKDEANTSISVSADGRLIVGTVSFNGHIQNCNSNGHPIKVLAYLPMTELSSPDMVPKALFDQVARELCKERKTVASLWKHKTKSELLEKELMDQKRELMSCKSDLREFQTRTIFGLQTIETLNKSLQHWKTIFYKEENRCRDKDQELVQVQDECKRLSDEGQVLNVQSVEKNKKIDQLEKRLKKVETILQQERERFAKDEQIHKNKVRKAQELQKSSETEKNRLLIELGEMKKQYEYVRQHANTLDQREARGPEPDILQVPNLNIRDSSEPIFPPISDHHEPNNETQAKEISVTEQTVPKTIPNSFSACGGARPKTAFRNLNTVKMKSWPVDKCSHCYKERSDFDSDTKFEDHVSKCAS